MGRPRLPRDADGNIVRDAPPTPPLNPTNSPDAAEPDGCPDRIVNGRPNALFYAWKISRANLLASQHIEEGKPLPWNHDGYIKGIMTEAKMAGVDVAEIADHRTDRQRQADIMLRIHDEPDAIWEMVDADAKVMLAGMDNADEYVRDNVDARFDAIMRSALSGKLQRLKTRIQTVLSLRDRARNPLPKNSFTQKHHETKASHLLRFMLYVGRSNIPSDEPGGTIFKIGRHHAKIAWDIYEAERGLLLDFDRREHKNIIEEEKVPYIGVTVVASVGHGKSEIATHYTARAICFDPEIQAVMLHAVSMEAEKNLRYVASCFDRSNAVGRRCMALFPIELEASTGKRMKVKLGRPLKQSTLEAYGFMSGRLGINTGLQVWDDIVPQSDVNEETTRKRRFDRMGGTWMTRQRGKKTFILNICTLWHHDDTNCRIIRAAKNEKNPMMFRVSRQGCGGPHTTPRYKPLWPEMYSADFLRQKAASMSPALYSAAYMSDPRSAEGRIVKELRLYDQGSAEHREFLSRAIRYISLDPSGVNRKGADKAGFVYGGMGDSVYQSDTEYTSRNTLRILAAKQFNATQTDLVEYACGFAADHKVDYVLAEQQGLSAIADIFRNYHGVDVIPIAAGNKDKGQRLRRVAGMLDEAQARVGGPNAVVEFPGIREGDRLVLDPEYKELAEQILDFGVAANDGLLDATSQLCYHLMPQLAPGAGAVTHAVRSAAPMTDMQRRKKAMLDSMNAKAGESAAEQDYQWACKWTSN